MTDFSTNETCDFTRMKKMREGGYFESDGSVPMPEFTGPSEIEQLKDKLKVMGYAGITPEQIEKKIEYWRRKVAEFGAIYNETTRILDAPPHARKYAQTNLFCNKQCQRMTQHGQVGTYANTGRPVFHCNICCACHLCIERLAGSERLYRAVNGIGDKLAAWEAGGGTVISPTFCTECGAMLRCSVCVSNGPGGYCRGCGQKGCAIEGCDAS